MLCARQLRSLSSAIRIRRAFAPGRHQRAQQGTEHRGIPLESPLDGLGAERFALAINQRLDGSRNSVARPLERPFGLPLCPGSNGRPRRFWAGCSAEASGAAAGASFTNAVRTTPNLARRLRANLPLERRRGVRGLLPPERHRDHEGQC
jgi:hypothetical protein